MLPLLVLAVSATLLSLDSGQLHLTVPASVRVQRHKVNFETDEYELYEENDKTPLLLIVDGGGAYDLRGFTKICLNGRRAWRTESVDSGTLVVGQPGVNAVSAYWSKLSGERLSEAKGILSRFGSTTARSAETPGISSNSRTPPLRTRLFAHCNARRVRRIAAAHRRGARCRKPQRSQPTPSVTLAI